LAGDAAPKGPADPAEPEEPRPSKTPRCAQVRDAALAARRIHDRDGVLQATKARECWASARARKQLETQAYMELGRFSDCLRVGEDLTDTQARTWVTLCKKRLGG
jgi:eukaryotic-like serine/threonine-protein kinase